MMRRRIRVELCFIRCRRVASVCYQADRNIFITISHETYAVCRVRVVALCACTVIGFSLPGLLRDENLNPTPSIE